MGEFSKTTVGTTIQHLFKKYAFKHLLKINSFEPL